MDEIMDVNRKRAPSLLLDLNCPLAALLLNGYFKRKEGKGEWPVVGIVSFR